MSLRLQNYLDQYTLDRVALKIVSTNNIDTLLNLRKHERPHVVICPGDFLQKDFKQVSPSPFRELSVWTRIATWDSLRLSFGKKKKHLGTVNIDIVNKPCHDMLPDSKKRTGLKPLVFVKVNGGFFTESRVVGDRTLLTRTITDGHKKNILAAKIPLYASKPTSAKGKLFFNMTSATPTTLDSLVGPCRDVRDVILQSKGSATCPDLENQFQDTLLQELQDNHLLLKTGLCYRMSPRGNYLVFYNS